MPSTEKQEKKILSARELMEGLHMFSRQTHMQKRSFVQSVLVYIENIEERFSKTYKINYMKNDGEYDDINDYILFMHIVFDLHDIVLDMLDKSLLAKEDMKLFYNARVGVRFYDDFVVADDDNNNKKSPAEEAAEFENKNYLIGTFDLAVRFCKGLRELNGKEGEKTSSLDNMGEGDLAHVGEREKTALLKIAKNPQESDKYRSAAINLLLGDPFFACLNLKSDLNNVKETQLEILKNSFLAIVTNQKVPPRYRFRAISLLLGEPLFACLNLKSDLNNVKETQLEILKNSFLAIVTNQKGPPRYRFRAISLLLGEPLFACLELKDSEALLPQEKGPLSVTAVLKHIGDFYSFFTSEEKPSSEQLLDLKKSLDHQVRWVSVATVNYYAHCGLKIKGSDMRYYFTALCLLAYIANKDNIANKNMLEKLTTIASSSKLFPTGQEKELKCYLTLPESMELAVDFKHLFDKPLDISLTSLQELVLFRDQVLSPILGKKQVLGQIKSQTQKIFEQVKGVFEHFISTVQAICKKKNADINAKDFELLRIYLIVGRMKQKTGDNLVDQKVTDKLMSIVNLTNEVSVAWLAVMKLFFRTDVYPVLLQSNKVCLFGSLSTHFQVMTIRLKNQKTGLVGLPKDQPAKLEKLEELIDMAEKVVKNTNNFQIELQAVRKNSEPVVAKNAQNRRQKALLQRCQELIAPLQKYAKNIIETWEHSRSKTKRNLFEKITPRLTSFLTSENLLEIPNIKKSINSLHDGNISKRDVIDAILDYRAENPGVSLRSLLKQAEAIQNKRSRWPSLFSNNQKQTTESLLKVLSRYKTVSKKAEKIDYIGQSFL